MRYFCWNVQLVLCARRDFDGKLWHKEGIRLGYLEQEPQLDPSKNVAGNIMDGLREKTELLTRMDELSAELGNPDADMDAVRCLHCCPLRVACGWDAAVVAETLCVMLPLWPLGLQPCAECRQADGSPSLSVCFATGHGRARQGAGAGGA